MKTKPLFLALAITTSSIWSISFSAAQDQVWNAFGSVDSAIDAELNDWFESTYLPNLESSEYHLRSRFVSVDPIELGRRFQASFDDAGRFERDTSGRLVYPDELLLSESDILLEMFPGATYRISIVRHVIGRYGLTMVHGWIMENGFTGRERVYFEIKSDGRIICSFLAYPRMYRVSPTPMESIVVVSEFDHDGYMKSNSGRLH